MGRINYDYFKIAKEIPLLLGLELKKNLIKNGEKPKRILIINVSLVGDFVASLPALASYIKKHQPAKIEIIVSPALASLAKKIKGVEKVYTVKSIYQRSIENFKSQKNSLEEYDEILVMRISEEAYKLLDGIKFSNLKSYFKPYIKYFFRVTAHIFGKRDLKQWKEFNFEIIGEPAREVKFNDIFNFKNSDYKKIMHLPGMKGKGKKVVIHTGSGWSIKFWSVHKWIEVLEGISKLGNFKFIFLGSTKDEENSFRQIGKKLKFKIYSLINKTNTAQTMMLLRKSDYFIGVDSGPRNMSHLAELPSISLLGPGPKNFMPTSKKDIVIDKSDCMCTNLFCYKRESCLEKICVSEVLEGFKKLSKK